jgi:H+/Cl- antiporter ClcA
MTEEFETSQKKLSKWWYLLPIFFGILGGIAAYLLLQDKDKKFAKRLIIIGIIMTVVWIVIGFILPIILSFISYKYISQTFETSSQGIAVIDSYCSGTTVSILIRNIGTNSITSLSCIQTAPAGDTCSFSGVNIAPGTIQTFTDTCSGTGERTCLYRITPPTGRSVEASVYCS